MLFLRRGINESRGDEQNSPLVDTSAPSPEFLFLPVSAVTSITSNDESERNVFAAGDRVLINVEDHCGGLLAGVGGAAAMCETEHSPGTEGDMLCALVRPH